MDYRLERGLVEVEVHESLKLMLDLDFALLFPRIDEDTAIPSSNRDAMLLLVYFKRIVESHHLSFVVDIVHPISKVALPTLFCVLSLPPAFAHLSGLDGSSRYGVIGIHLVSEHGFRFSFCILAMLVEIIELFHQLSDMFLFVLLGQGNLASTS